MSRQNKVNPGMYTQRGRLTQDDAARELAKQRSVGSEHTWQPVQRDAQPRLTSKTEGDDAAAADQVDETPDEKPVRVTAKVKPAKMAPRKMAPRTTASRKTASRKTANARATTKAGAKKTTASSMKVKAKSARTNKTKAKSARRRKS